MPPKASDRTWTRLEIAESILKGNLLTVYNDKVLRLNSWSSHHPGGELVVSHYVGRDATDELDAYHSDDTLKRRVPKFCVGTLAQEEKDPFASLVPPIMLGFQLSKSASGDATWIPLDGPVLALAHSRSLRQQAASSSSSPVQSTLSFTHPQPLTLQLEDLFPAPAPPSLSSSETQKAHTMAYRTLHQRVKDAGLYTAPSWGGYFGDIIRYVLLGASALALWWLGTGAEVGSWKRVALIGGSAVSLGLFWDQLTFLAHDLGHTSLKGGDWVWNRLAGMLVANFIGGLSLGWWTDNHNTHHLVTNHPEHDPDIQHIPFFAITTQFFSSLFSTYYNHVKTFDSLSRFMIAHQHRTYYPILALARFNLYANSYGFLVKKSLAGKRNAWWWFEVAGIAVFWSWFGYGVLGGLKGWKEVVGYLLISHICASPVHVQIVLSHFSRSTEDLGVGESFPHRQLRTTMDVICDPSIEFIHGGLDKQVTHHLFPRLPRHNLRAASLMVKEFCKEQDLEFAEWGFVEGSAQVMSVLKSVSQQIELMGLVAEAEAKGDLSQEKKRAEETETSTSSSN